MNTVKTISQAIAICAIVFFSNQAQAQEGWQGSKFEAESGVAITEPVISCMYAVSVVNVKEAAEMGEVEVTIISAVTRAISDEQGSFEAADIVSNWNKTNNGEFYISPVNYIEGKYSDYFDVDEKFNAEVGVPKRSNIEANPESGAPFYSGRISGKYPEWDN